MVYCNIKGGLANIMFQIAASKAISSDLGMDFSICNLTEQLNFLNIESHHNPGLKHAHKYLDNIHGIRTDKPGKHLRTYNYPFEYVNLNITDSDFIIDGFFQSEKYFSKYRDEILDMFKMSDEVEQIINTRYSNLLEKRTTSLHVRRGDYVRHPQHHPVQSMEYLTKSIELLDEETDYFLVFSDDIRWCRENLKSDKMVFIEDVDYIELYLMSQCNNNIIANSSFSWWGAWLNKDSDKKVIAPNNWFGPAIQEKTNDIIPESWIKI